MSGKRTKLPAPDLRKAAPSPDALGRVEAHLARTLELVEAAIDRGEATPAVVRESANVARAIVTLSAERRACAKSDRVRVEDLAIGDVITWLRAADMRSRWKVNIELRVLLDDGPARGVLG